MMKRQIFKILLILTPLVQSVAQSINIDIIPGYTLGYDTGYVKSFRDNLVLTLVNESKFSRINVAYTLPQKSYALNYKTNDLNTWGIGIDYKWLTFEYTTRMPWYQPNPAFGDAKNSGIGFGITGRKLSFRFFYQRYQEYYLENSIDWFPNLPVDKFYLRPDIQTQTYYTNLNYVFNHKKFSNNAALWQLERQEKKAGSFVAGLSYIYNTFQADSSIIPVKADSLPKSNDTFFALNALGINGGFVGTIPFGKKKKFFISGAIIPGFSWQWGRLSVEGSGIERDNSVLGFQSEARFSIGYNGDLWYMGFMARGYGNLNNLAGNEPFSINNSFGRLYIGYRFKPIKHQLQWLKRIGL
jgi:hypothetical protein